VDTATLRVLCLVLSALAILAGGMGMALSFLYMASASLADITAASAGFVAGSVLIGSGLVSLTLLATRREQASATPSPEPDRPGSEKVVTFR
jgi:hypothetical protein